MKVKKGLLTSLIFIVLALCSTYSFNATTKISAESEPVSVNEIAITLPSETINGISTLNGENFTFTNNKTTLYHTTTDDFTEKTFKVLDDNSNLPTTNRAVTLRNNTSFVYSNTEQFTNQHIIALYKILENEDPTNNIYFYNEVYKNESNISYLSEISDMCFDYYNNLYLLDINNKAILTFSYSNDRIEIYKDLSELVNSGELTLDSSSKICCTINGKAIFIFSNNKVLKLSTDTKNIIPINICVNIDYLTVKDFDCDVSESLFFLCDSNLFKQTVNGNYETLTLPIAPNEAFIEQYSGLIFLLYNNSIYSLNSENFTTNLIYYPAPINFNEESYINDITKIATTSSQTQLFTSPFALEATNIIPAESKIFILEENIPNISDFSYCLYENNNSKNIGYIKKDSLTNTLNFINDVHVKKTFIKTNVYKYPTKQSIVLTTIDDNTTVNILGYYEDLHNSENNFYCIEITENSNNKIAFIDKNMLYSLNSTEIEYTGGTETPDKYSKFIEYLLIIAALSIFEVVCIAFIIKKTPITKKKTNN